MLIILRKHAEVILGLECLTSNASEEFLGHSSAINASLHGPKSINKADLDWFLETVAQWVELSKGIVEDIFTPNLGLVASKHILDSRVSVDHLAHGSLSYGGTPGVGIDESVSSTMLIMKDEFAEDLDPSGKRDEKRHISKDLQSGCNGCQHPSSSNPLLMTPQRLKADGLLSVARPRKTKRRVFILIHQVRVTRIIGPGLKLMSSLLFSDNSRNETLHIKPAGHEPVIFRQELPA
jgi:hypothetical protein